jgi:O-antigen/teichoic acid export membrane protein
MTRALFIMKIRAWSLLAKFILTLFIAKFMDFEDLGLYGLISAASIIFPGFTGLGLIYMLSRKAVTAPLEEIVGMLRQYGRFIGLIYFATAPIAFVTGILMDRPVLALLVTAVVALEHINSDIYSLLLNRSKPLSANVLHFLRTAAWIILFIPVAFFVPALRHLDVLLAFWITGGIAALAGFFWVARAWPWMHKEDETSLGMWIRQNFRESRLLYLNGCATSFSQYIDRYLVTFFLGLELTGVYVFFCTVAGALGNLLLTGIIQVARPVLVKLFKEGKLQEYKAAFIKCMRHTAFIAIVMAFFAIALVWFLVPYLDKPQIAYWMPVCWIILAGFVLNVLLEVQKLVFYSQHLDLLTLKNSIIAAFVACLLNVILIPHMGLWGAGATYFICPALLMSIQYYQIKHIEKLKV